MYFQRVQNRDASGFIFQIVGFLETPVPVDKTSDRLGRNWQIDVCESAVVE